MTFLNTFESFVNMLNVDYVIFYEWVPLCDWKIMNKPWKLVLFNILEYQCFGPGVSKSLRALVSFLYDLAKDLAKKYLADMLGILFIINIKHHLIEKIKDAQFYIAWTLLFMGDI